MDGQWVQRAGCGVLACDHKAQVLSEWSQRCFPDEGGDGRGARWVMGGRRQSVGGPCPPVSGLSSGHCGLVGPSGCGGLWPRVP